MKKFVVILLFYSFVSIVHGMKLAEFEDIYKPSQIVVSGNDIYVVDGETIKLFSIKNMELKKMIGKKGEGPGEFRMTPVIQIFPEKIFATDYGKVLFFKRDGKFIREIKITDDISMEKVKDNYISIKHQIDTEKKVSVSMFSVLDADFKVVKELFSTTREIKGLSGGSGKMNKRTMELFRKANRIFTNGEFIYVMDTNNGFNFEILDHEGNLVNTIKRKVSEIKISDKFKKEFIDELKELSSWKKWGSRLNYVFPEYFPAISYISGDQNRIYVLSNVDNIKKYQLTVYDLKAKLLKEVLVPRVKISTIHNKKFYYMRENEDDEVWELHSVDL